VTATLAVACLMAIWWISETIPLAVTALVPLVLFPAFGVLDGLCPAHVGGDAGDGLAGYPPALPAG